MKPFFYFDIPGEEDVFQWHLTVNDTKNSNSDEKSYLIDKEMVIYSTLIEAATEHVEIFGKAGSTTIREIKIENPQDSTIVLFVEKVSLCICASTHIKVSAYFYSLFFGIFMKRFKILKSLKKF